MYDKIKQLWLESLKDAKRLLTDAGLEVDPKVAYELASKLVEVKFLLED